MAPDTCTLAGSDVTIPLLGVGTWAWGDSSTWGMGTYDASLTEETIREAWEASIDAGAAFFDTAEVYGGGESERIIGRLLAADPGRASQAVLATKFMPSPWKLNVTSALMGALRASLDRLGVEKVALYQIHGPISLRSHAALAEALADVIGVPVAPIDPRDRAGDTLADLAIVWAKTGPDGGAENQPASIAT